MLANVLAHEKNDEGSGVKKLNMDAGISLKDLILHCIKTYPQLIASNSLSTGMCLLDKILFLLRTTLEYGFWNISEIENLLKQLKSSVFYFLKIEIMVQEMQGQLTPHDLGKIIDSLKLCRQNTAICLFQIILILNDAVFVNNFKDLGDGFQISKDLLEGLKTENILTPFFNNPNIIKYCSSILLNYLLKNDRIAGVELNGDQEKDYLNTLVNQIFQIDKEPFMLSIENMDQYDVWLYK